MCGSRCAFVRHRQVNKFARLVSSPQPRLDVGHKADRREDPGPWTDCSTTVAPEFARTWTLREATRLQPPHDRSASDALIVDLDVTASRIAHLPGAINGPTLSAGFDWCVRTR